MSGYPLEAAKTLRASERERAERALADRERELSEARAGTQAARDALAAHRERMAARRAPAPTTGAALQREQAFLDRLRAEEEALRKALTDQAATPWNRHAVFGADGAQFVPADQSFRHSYSDFG